MFLKDPDSLLDYRVDWGATVASGTQIVSSSWQVVPSEAGGVAVAGTGLAGAIASVRLGGGVPGHVYVVGNRVSLSDATSDERSLTIRVENR